MILFVPFHVHSEGSRTDGNCFTFTTCKLRLESRRSRAAGEHKFVTLSLSWRSFYPRMSRVPEDTTPTPSDTFPTVPDTS